MSNVTGDMPKTTMNCHSTIGTSDHDSNIKHLCDQGSIENWPKDLKFVPGLSTTTNHWEAELSDTETDNSEGTDTDETETDDGKSTSDDSSNTVDDPTETNSESETEQSWIEKPEGQFWRHDSVTGQEKSSSMIGQKRSYDMTECMVREIKFQESFMINQI